MISTAEVVIEGRNKTIKDEPSQKAHLRFDLAKAHRAKVSIVQKAEKQAVLNDESSVQALLKDVTRKVEREGMNKMAHPFCETSQNQKIVRGSSSSCNGAAVTLPST